MKTIQVRVRPDRLEIPLARITAGRGCALALTITGDIPDGVSGLRVAFMRPGGLDPVSVEATAQDGGGYAAYAPPAAFPAAHDALEYTVTATDSGGNPTWLGTGTLTVRDVPLPAGGASDTYVLNPSTGLYHRLTVVTDEDGEATLSLSDTGEER